MYTFLSVFFDSPRRTTCVSRELITTAPYLIRSITRHKVLLVLVDINVNQLMGDEREKERVKWKIWKKREMKLKIKL